VASNIWRKVSHIRSNSHYLATIQKVSAVDTTFLFAYTSLFVKNIYHGKKQEGRKKGETSPIAASN